MKLWQWWIIGAVIGVTSLLICLKLQAECLSIHDLNYCLLKE